MWCLTTRVNPRADILNPIPGGRGQTFMPAERMTAGEKQWTASNTQFEGGMGIDATVPFGYESDFLRPVYPVDRVKPEDFFTKKDIENAKSRMHGLGAFAGADGAVRTDTLSSPRKRVIRVCRRGQRVWHDGPRFRGDDTVRISARLPRRASSVPPTPADRACRARSSAVRR